MLNTFLIVITIAAVFWCGYITGRTHEFAVWTKAIMESRK